jgi:hypothetical protein
VSPGRFLLYIVFTLIAFAGLVLLFAWFQSWLETGQDEGPPDNHGDVPHVPTDVRPR